jgi:hypothetical protein
MGLTEPEYVELLGRMLAQGWQVEELEKLLRSIPDAHTFQKIRKLFFEKFHAPFLPAFLQDLNPEHHVRVLNAYRVASRDYQ